MKKLVAVLISVLLLITFGCSKNNTPQPISSKETNEINLVLSKKEVINIIKLIDTVVSYSKSDIDAWESYMFDTFDLNIKLHHVYSIEGLNSKIKNLDYNGLVVVQTKEVIAELIQSDSITPINSYVGIEYIKNLIPEYIFDYSKDSNNNIWLLPSSVVKYVNGRTYDADFLTSNSLQIPISLDEFKNLAVAIAKKNNIPNTSKHYIAEFHANSILKDFQDIFIAYGVFPDYDSTIPHLSYNYISKQWEDITYTENFKEAILFIKYLYDNKLIASYTDDKHVSTHTHSEGFHNTGIVSYYGSAYDDAYEGKFTSSSVGLYIDGMNSRYLINVKSNNKGFAVLKNTKNIPNILSALLQDGNPSEDLKNAFVYGIPGYNYNYKGNDQLELYTKNESGETINFIGISFSYFRYGKVSVVNGYDNNIDEMKKSLLYVESIFDLINSTNEALMYISNVSIKQNTAKKEVSGLNISSQYFSEFISQVLYNDISIDTAVEEYRIKCNNLSINEFLNNVNK